MTSFFTFGTIKFRMKELLEKFENKTPEVVFQWKDSQTEAKGWVVINSLEEVLLVGVQE